MKAEHKAYLVTALIVVAVLVLITRLDKDSETHFGLSYQGTA